MAQAEDLAAVTLALRSLGLESKTSADNLRQLNVLRKQMNDKQLDSITALAKQEGVGQALISAAHDRMFRDYQSSLNKMHIISADAQGKMGAIMSLTWQRIKDAGTGTLSNISGISAETLSGFGSLAAVGGILLKVLDALTDQASHAVDTQLSYASAGGAVTSSFLDANTVMKSSAWLATEYALDLKDLDEGFLKVMRSSVLGNAEISNMSQSLDVTSAAFIQMRNKLSGELIASLAEVQALGPAFGKTSSQMTDMVVDMKGNLGSSINDMGKSFLSLLDTSARTGINVDVLWTSLNKLGAQYKFLGVGIEPLNRDFATLGAYIQSMGPQLATVNSNSQMFTQIISDLSDSFAKMPMEQVVALEQLAHPGASIGKSVEEGFKATPLTRMMMESNLVLKNLHMSSRDAAGVLAMSLPSIKDKGSESFEMAKVLVSLQGQSSRIQTMSAEQQAKFLSNLGPMGDTIKRLTLEQRATSGGVLQSILKEITNIGAIISRGIIGLTLGGLSAGRGWSSPAPSTPVGSTPGSSHSVAPAF